jgi:hypothetical protein
LNLNEHIESVRIDFENKNFYLNVLDISYMMRTKLRTLSSREAAKDYDDVEFLLRCYGDQIRTIARGLHLEDRVYFIDTDVVQSRGSIMVNQYKCLLELGV